ncbi:MAG: hypothetical protein R1F52_02970 [Candidatus Nitrosoabyssus spongiisocia]|nr:MAG: hypothetical protein R1F52_02970 [Nitrosopumilaceae archaeon AB1(1)]
MVLSISADPVLWFETIKTYFSDFKPETKSMCINFNDKTCEIGLSFHIEEGYRKNHKTLKIPNFSGFRIVEMQDAVFNSLKPLWKLIDNEWILDAKTLPKSDGYFVKLEGGIKEESLKNLVHIKPSINRDPSDDYDKYWLDASLKDPKKLENIWTELEIDEINVNVKVDINKLFAIQLPQEIQDKAAAIQKFLHAGKTGDRESVFRGMHDLRKQERKNPFRPNDFWKIIQNLTTKQTLKEYLTVDQRFILGNVDNSSTLNNLMPENIKVQAITKLSLREPTSIGYLTLKKKLYLERIKKDFNKVLSKKP